MTKIGEFTYDDMLDIAGHMAAAGAYLAPDSCKRPVHELKAEAVAYIEKKRAQVKDGLQARLGLSDEEYAKFITAFQSCLLLWSLDGQLYKSKLLPCKCSLKLKQCTEMCEYRNNNFTVEDDCAPN